ncbi:MAG: hypothetical protein KJO18_04535 [Acidimicrobiia bacterium]|nr:hypothetical protein [Acidimicrobiia bacterium]
MLKTALVVPESERENAVSLLGKLGVVQIHFESRAPGTAGEEARQLANVQSAISILESADATPQPEDRNTPRDPDLSERILNLDRRRAELAADLTVLEKEAQRIAPFGDFEPGSMAPLAAHGLSLRLHRCTPADIKDLPSSLPCSIVGRSKGQVFLAVFRRESDEFLRLPEVNLPASSLDDLRSRIAEHRNRLEEIEMELSAHRCHLAHLNSEAVRLQQRVEINRAVKAFRIDAPVAALKGYCPAPDMDRLQKLAAAEGWVVLSESPGPEDAPPTLIRSKPWIDAALPLYRLINSLPGYRELDVTPWFLLFFAIFFGILIGDAGYGALLVVGLVILRTVKPVPAPLLRLGWILGGTTMIWGAITGNWFGLEALSSLPLLRSLVIPQLHAYTAASQDNVMQLSFLIGTAHLTLAHLLLAVRSRRSLSALAQIGWILIVWSALFIVRFLVLERPVPDGTYPLLGAGILLVVPFTNPEKGLLRGMGSGIGNLPLKLMNCFSDIISYIRLFAVGIATLAVAASFNEIASTFSSGGFFGMIAALLILLVGHSLNILMAGLSVIVHGIRLNMLEFSGHAGMEWSGTEFNPFKLVSPSDP